MNERSRTRHRVVWLLVLAPPTFIGLMPALPMLDGWLHEPVRGAASALIQDTDDISDTVRIYLPLALGSNDLSQPEATLPATATVSPSHTAAATATAIPSEQATASAIPSASPTSNVTAEPSATNSPSPAVDPPVCDLPLAARLIKTQIAIAGTVAVQIGPGERYPVFTAPHEGGGVLLGWIDTEGWVHLTEIDAAGRRQAADRVLPGRSIHGLVAHSDGSAALLVARPDKLLLIKVDAAGALLFEKTLVGGQPHNAHGSRWIDDSGYESRLIWTGDVYAANFGNRISLGARGEIQHNMLRLFAFDGWTLNPGQEGHYPSWEANCTQSLDLRLSYNQLSDQIAPICLSDGKSYPGAGVFFSRHAFALREGIQIGGPMASNRDGQVKGQLGGVTALDEGFAVTYATETGRRMADIALSFISSDGNSQREVWLTNTPGQGESAPHMARYGPDLAAGWKDWDGRLEIQQLDHEGNPRGDGQPQRLDADVAARDDWVNLEDRAIAWTYVGEDRTHLTYVRIPYCP